MWGIPTMKKLNDEAAEGAAIMARSGHTLPKIEPSVIQGTHQHRPLGSAEFKDVKENADAA
jgi:hypothetical protein